MMEAQHFQVKAHVLRGNAENHLQACPSATGSQDKLWLDYLLNQQSQNTVFVILPNQLILWLMK
jgi:hypothetical protein